MQKNLIFLFNLNDKINKICVNIYTLLVKKKIPISKVITSKKKSEDHSNYKYFKFFIIYLKQQQEQEQIRKKKAIKKSTEYMNE